MFIPFIERFEGKALKNSNNKAITSPREDLNFDYHTFNLNSNKIAHHLRILGISKGDIVGFSSDRTINSYLIILALLKLRATIIPLDLEYPSDFLEFITPDSRRKKDKSYGPLGKNAKLYKTGDLVRWLPDGNLTRVAFKEVSLGVDVKKVYQVGFGS